MNERLKKLRKALGLSQEKFGELLGITKSGVSDLESGRRSVTKQHLILLQNNGVNEEWLRTGVGEMFAEKTEDEEISEMLADIQLSGSGSFKHRLAVSLARLDDDGWKWLEEFVNSIANQSDNQV